MTFSSTAEYFSMRTRPGVERARRVELGDDPSRLILVNAVGGRFTVEQFRELLISAVMSGVDDLTFQSGGPVVGILYQRLRFLTDRALSETEINDILTEIYGEANVISELKSRNILDFSYELNLPDGNSRRFRVNATPISSGVEITFRAFPVKTPDFKMNLLKDKEVEVLKPRVGLVLISGETGSGKSTFMASLIGDLLSSVELPRKIVDLQAPIEFNYRDILLKNNLSPSVIGQSEVGRDIRSFAEGMRSALRRNPNVISVGEARDEETIRALLLAATSGHACYSTTHANSIEETFDRVLSEVPAGSRESAGYQFLKSVHFIAAQVLIKREDKPGMLPVREYLEFTPALKERLQSLPMNQWAGLIRKRLRGEHGFEDTGICQRYDQVCRYLRDRGAMSDSDALNILGRQNYAEFM